MTYSDRVFLGSCENMSEIPDGVVDVCVTSPPYFNLRDYGVEGQIGLEETPAEYIAKMVAVMREVRRVLKPQGTAWVNIGDSYFGDSPVRKASSEAFSQEWDKSLTRSRGGTRRSAASWGGLKPKDLMMIPHRVAIALQEDGWWVRDDIAWIKPNPMPSSVNDRCTPCKEYVFQLAKSRKYYADMESVKEPLAESSVQRLSQSTFDQQTGGEKDYANGTNPNRSIRKTLENLKRKQDALGKDTYSGFNARYADRPQTRRAIELAQAAGLTDEHLAAIRAVGISDAGKAQKTQTGFGKNAADVQRLADEAKAALGGYYREFLLVNGANLRNAWTIATEPYAGAHFAVMPRELVRRCILIGSPAGGLVLDPFMGSGTVAEVAIGCGRHYVGYELNPEYHKLIADRLGLFGAA